MISKTKIKLLIWSIVFIITTFFINQILILWNFEWIKSFLTEKKIEKLDPSSLTDTSKVIQLWNIFDFALEWAKKIDFASDMKAFEFILREMKKINENCESSVDDVINVFWNSKEWERILKEQDIKPSWWKNNFWESCSKVVKCIDSETQLDKWWEESEYNSNSSRLCSNYVMEQYDIQKEIISNDQSMEQSNYWDDVFFNWDDSDWPFDMMSQSKQNSDIIFANNQSYEEVGAYKDFNNWWAKNWDSLSYNSSDKKFVLNRNWIYKKSNDYIYADSSNFVEQNQTQNYNIDEDLEYLNYKNSSSNNLSIINNTPTNKNIDNSCFPINWNILNKLNYKEKEIQQRIDTVYWIAQRSSKFDWDNEDYENVIDLYSSDYNLNDYIADFRTNLFNVDNNYYVKKFKQEAWIKSDISNKTTSYWAIPSNWKINIWWCEEKCKNLSEYDKKVCESECKWWTTRWLDWVNNNKLANVPDRKQPDVPDWQEFKTLEESIEASLNIVSHMKESWELMPHRMQDEWFSTNLQSIKYPRLLGHDAILEQRPEPQDQDKQHEKDRIKTQEKEFNQEKEKSILWFYPNDLDKWKKRYILWWNENAENNQNSFWSQVNEMQNNRETTQNYDAQSNTDNSDVDENTQSQQNYKNLESINRQLEDTDRMIKLINKQMNDFFITTQSLKTKVVYTADM